MFGWFKQKAPRAETTIVDSGGTAMLSNMQSWDDLLHFDTGGSITVTPQTAMRHSAVYACVRIIAGSISSLPFQTYSTDGGGNRTYERDSEFSRLLKLRPNPRMSAALFWRQIVANMLLRGNGIAWIERRNSGAPIAIWPIPFDRVGISLKDGRLIYRMTLDDGKQVIADQDDVLHIPGTMEWDGLKAKTPIEVFASSVGIGLEANRYAGLFFKNDATPPSYISYPDRFQNTAGQAEEIRNQWNQKFGGNNRHKGPMVLDQGGAVKQLEIKATDSQILETRQFQVVDIARIFGVPPHLIASTEKNTALGSSVEHQNIAFVQFTIGPHNVAIEQEVNEKLHRTSGRFSEIDTNGLLKGDIKARFEAYRLSLGGSSGPGFMTQNEARRSENLPRIDGGDELVGWSAREQQARNDGNAPPDETSNQ